MSSNSSKPSSDAGFKTTRVFLASVNPKSVITPHPDSNSEKESASNHEALIFTYTGDPVRPTEKQTDWACQQAFLTERHRAPKGVRVSRKQGALGTSQMRNSTR